MHGVTLVQIVLLDRLVANECNLGTLLLLLSIVKTMITINKNGD